jgi:predicted esterase
LRDSLFVPGKRYAAVSVATLLSASAALADSAELQEACSAGKRDSELTISTQLASTPALVRIPKQIGHPPVVLWHGFGPPADEKALLAALPLDDVPAIKVYLGLPLSGGREPAGGRDEMIRRQQEDFGRLKHQRCMGSTDRIGLFGFSAGGTAALLALAEGKVPISAVVLLNASTGLNASVQAYERVMKQQYRWTQQTRDLARKTDAIRRAADIARGKAAVLIVHGSDDAILPAQVAVALRDALAPYYKRADREAQLHLQLVPGLAHGWVESAQAHQLRRSIAEWFTRHA